MPSLLSLRIGKTLDYNRDTYQGDGGNNPNEVQASSQSTKAPRVHIPYSTPTSPKSQPLPSLLSLRTGPKNTPEKPLDYYRPDALDAASFVNSIITQESGGDYNAMGLKTKSGDRAYGKYQVMGANIPQWTKETLGIQMSPQQYLKDQKAQDTLANKRLTDLFNKHGVADAAAIWFSGGTLAKNGWKKDANGKSVADYVKDVVSRLGMKGQMASAASALGIPSAKADTKPSKPLPSLLDMRIKSGFHLNSQLDNQEAAKALIMGMLQNIRDKGKLFPQEGDTPEIIAQKGMEMSMNFGPGALGTISKKGAGKVSQILAEAQSPLALEAQKYKSAEEFVADMRDPSPDTEAPHVDGIYYHGDWASGGASKMTVEKGLSLSANSSFAKQYAYREGGDNSVLRPFSLSPNAKILDVTDQGIDPHSNLVMKDGKLVSTGLLKQAEKDGYDAVKLNASSPIGERGGTGEELYVINPKVVKELTKSQLTDFYNKVKGAQKTEPLAQEAQKYSSAEELFNDPESVFLFEKRRPQVNPFQDTLPSKTRPNSIKEIVKSGGNPLYHDTDSRGVLGILDSGEIKIHQAPFGQIAGQGKRVSTTRNFDNYSRYHNSPYRFVIDESKTGQRAIPDNREEFESIFRKNVKADAISSLAIDSTNPAILDDIKSGKLEEIIKKAKDKGIKVELFEGKILPNEYSNKEIQTLTKSQLTDIWNKAQGTTPKTSLGSKIIATGDQKPTIKLKRDVTITTLSGEKVVIDSGEVLKADEKKSKPLPSLLDVRLRNPQKWTPTIEDVQGFHLNSQLDNPDFGKMLMEGMIQNVKDKFPHLTEENAIEEGTKMGMNFGGGALGTTKKVVGEAAAPIFKGFQDLSTKLLEKLKGRTTVSKQFISDLTNQPDLKQPERDLIRTVLQGEGKDVSVKDFANKVKTELLPLEREGTSNGYSGVALPDGLRGPIQDYGETVYSSPIKTSAGAVHFSGNYQNYFAHTRIEDLPGPKQLDTREIGRRALNGEVKPEERAALNAQLREIGNVKDGTTRRVIEIQSDLFQKGRLEKEADGARLPKDPALGWAAGESYGRLVERQTHLKQMINNAPKLETDANPKYVQEMKAELAQVEKGMKTLEAQEAPRIAELSKLEPYRNTWHERVIREEVKQAAKDGKTKLQFPTGETAMKIEGLGDSQMWHKWEDGEQLLKSDLKVGLEIGDTTGGEEMLPGGQWIITDVLGDGKFKAISKSTLTNTTGDETPQFLSDLSSPGQYEKRLLEKNGESAKDWIKQRLGERQSFLDRNSETFDISGKVDTNNPIYKFYNKEVRRYLTNKYGAKEIVDPQGVSWIEVPITPEMKKLPIEAFGAGLIPLMGQDQQQ